MMVLLAAAMLEGRCWRAGRDIFLSEFLDLTRDDSVRTMFFFGSINARIVLFDEGCKWGFP